MAVKETMNTESFNDHHSTAIQLKCFSTVRLQTSKSGKSGMLCEWNEFMIELMNKCWMNIKEGRVDVKSGLFTCQVCNSM